MKLLRVWRSRFAALWHRAERDRELSEELESHLQMHIEDNVRAGFSPEESRRRALVKLGGMQQVTENYRERRGVPMFEVITQDLRFALRMLRKSPGFTAVALLTLALGIGANSAIFGVVNGVLLRPLPFPQPERLVQVQSLIKNSQEVGGTSYLDFLDWKKQNTVFEDIGVYSPRSFALAGSGEAVRVRGVVISSSLLPVLGVQPVLGRWFLPEEDKPGAVGGADAVILGNKLWRERFGSDPAILGKTIELNRSKFTVVGVMPQGFYYPIPERDAELWVTVGVDGRPSPGETGTMLSERGIHYLETVARLKPGVTLAQANAQMIGIVAALNQQYPKEARGMRVVMEHDALVGDSRTALLVLLGSVGCVLLIACANLASLLLSRATARRRELAIRAALGAGRARLLQQLLVENISLCVLGGLLGFLVAYGGIQLLIQSAPQNVPRLAEVSLDRTVLLFNGGMTLLAAALLSLSISLHVSRQELAEGIREGDRSQTQGVARHRARNVLVAGQIALALGLLAVAGLLGQSLTRLLRVHPGFNPSNVLTFRIDVGDDYTPERQTRFYNEISQQLAALQGTLSASGVLGLPFSGVDIGTTYQIRGAEVPEEQEPRTRLNIVQPGYFRTLQIPIVAGRDFAEREDLKAEPVAIINEALAEKLGGVVAAMEKFIKPGVGNGYEKEPFRRIVGVVRNVRVTSLREDAKPEVYVPIAQCPGMGSMTMVVRTEQDPQSLAAPARKVVASLDKDIPVFRVLTLERYLAAATAESRFTALLLGAFAALALVVAGIGLYGVISYSVTQRTREIGIRMALGANRSSVLGQVVMQGMALSLAGVAVGLAGALALTHLLGALLFGVSARDPLTFLGAVGVLLSAAFCASYLPARRASRVDPLTALRHE